MKATFTISMYSGATPPETELTDAQSAKAMELAWLAWLIGKPYESRFGYHSMPSTDHYMVMWAQRYLGPVNAPIRGFRVHSDGFLHVYGDYHSEGVQIKDTTGLWGYLAKEVGASLLAKHIEEGNKQREEYYKKLRLEFYGDLSKF